jgi:hypothetical protein
LLKLGNNYAFKNKNKFKKYIAYGSESGPTVVTYHVGFLRERNKNE